MAQAGDDEMNVICLYWQGDFRGRDFGADNIHHLWQSVWHHIDRPFDFYILSNVELRLSFPATIIPLRHNFPGWWSKMELHRPDMPPGRTLYLDLDSYVIRDLSPILDYPGNLVMFPTPYDNKPGFMKEQSVLKYQASTMLFDPGCMSDLYEMFRKRSDAFMQKYRSDQDMMGDLIPDQPTFPSEWLAKLGKCSSKKAPDDAIIITGQPKDGSFYNPASKYPWLLPMARGNQ